MAAERFRQLSVYYGTGKEFAMQEQYEKPVVEVVEFEKGSDVLLTSPP